jgi:hypothetical protein
MHESDIEPLAATAGIERQEEALTGIELHQEL